MQGTKWWLVCYDVRDPDRLRKCAKHLEGYGERMQYSIFRVWLTRVAVEKLRWELTEILKEEDDLLFIPLCGECVTAICSTHKSAAEAGWPEVPRRHLIV